MILFKVIRFRESEPHTPQLLQKNNYHAKIAFYGIKRTCSVIISVFPELILHQQ